MDPPTKRRISADRDVCQASTLCTHIAPAYFEIADGAVRLLRTEVEEADQAAVAEAVGSCPTQALAFEPAPPAE